MMPIKKILCPTDFSEPSNEAIKIAGELASHFGAELCLVHVVSPVPVMPFPGGIPATFDIHSYQQELAFSSKKALEEVIQKMESGRVRSRLVVIQGDPAQKITDLVKEEKPDLMVLATHGKSGWERLIFGSVAEKVIHLTSCPVLLVRHADEEAEAAAPVEPEKGSFEIETLVQKPKELPADKKKVYQEKIDLQLKEWTEKIEDLKKKADQAKAEARVRYKEQIEGLRTKQEAVQEKVQELKDSGEEAWDELKVGLDNALSDLKKAFDRARSKFK